MRITVYSRAFLPLVGGLEVQTATLATAWAQLGHRVRVVTTTPDGPGPSVGPDVEVVRNPSLRRMLRCALDCDLLLYQNLSLRGVWAALLLRRPWAVSHHSWYTRSDGRVAWQDRLKRTLSRRALASIAVSRALAEDLGDGTLVIPNAYRDDLFRVLDPPLARERELLFVGRLVSDKGLDVLVAALGILARSGVHPRLTIVGSGPEERQVRLSLADLGLDAQVSFAGTVTGESLVRMYNRHRILVVPSRYREPFGMVALEGIACGCVVVGSSGGGLAEAIGPCGVTFPNGDAGALAARLDELLANPRLGDPLRQAAPAHLEAHRVSTVANTYTELLRSALERRRRTAA